MDSLAWKASLGVSLQACFIENWNLEPISVKPGLLLLHFLLRGMSPNIEHISHLCQAIT